ncbi:MAG: molecular chaperone HtpG [Anaerolineae bacterium]|nr:molecular chaperone HtpG [Anaerolineae bacterium]
MTEIRSFQAETQQLLNILIHSLYTERDIFLRELISNASDALNRLQFEQLTRSDIVSPEAEPAIRIRIDKDAKTLTISDTGVGMTREEAIENLGTIARSGAKKFIEAVQQAPGTEAAANIIGQFGVGFYSIFMVADKVRVVSRSFLPEAAAMEWEADGGTSYSIDAADKDTRGTDVILHLKEDAADFLNDWRIKDIVKKHSDYVAFPVYVGDDTTPANKQTALWRQSPREVTAEDYDGFYRMHTMDFKKPLYHIHMRADVPMQFYALLFIPAGDNNTMFSLRREPGLKLYARKVLIQEYHKDLLPEYLQFIQGVVDSEDLPLSVSRETVKSDRVIATLKKTLTAKALGDLKRLADKERDQYLEIYKAHGRFLKQGLVVTPADRSELLPLLFFQTSHDDNPGSYHALEDYTGRMVAGQTEIYYVIADDYTSARRSPHLDAFRQRGIEVLYFCDPVDSMLPMGLEEFKGFKFRSVDESDIDLKDVGSLPEETPARAPVAGEAFQSLTERVQAVLGDRVKAVVESKTLVGSPARLVSDEDSSGRHMFRINRLLDREYELPVKTLELNPRHPLMHNLAQLLAGGSSAALVQAVIEQVFENALLQDGLHPDPAAMAERMTLLMQAATGTPAGDVFSGPPAA